MTIDSKLSFDKHTRQLREKVRAKLIALARISPNINKGKRKIYMNSFLRAQFSYYSLIWMFYNRQLGKRINSLPEKCRARAVYEDNIST